MNKFAHTEEEYKKIILKLSTDEAFGIMTRQGLEYIMSGHTGAFNAIFIDFKNIRELNAIHGYEAVNHAIKGRLARLKLRGHLLARWFSGDEIVIINYKKFDHTFLKHIELTSMFGVPEYNYWHLTDINNINELAKRISVTCREKQ